MAVTNQLTTIHSCETGTDAVTGCTLTGADSNFGTAAGEYVEGSAGYIFDLDVETHTCVFTPSSSLNLTSQVVWLWMRFLTESFLDTWANGGVKCRLSDGTNYSEWYLGGSGRWGSAWVRVPFYTGSTPDAVSGTLNLSAVTVITYYFTGTVKSKLPQNVFIDYLQYGAVGAGIKVTGGGVGTEEAWSDVYGDDVTAAAGMLDYIDGVYYMNGSITFGDTATNSCYFEDQNQIIVTKDHYRSFTTTNRTSAESLVSSDHYKLKVQNYASGTCNFQLGETAGGRGTSGCIFKTGGNRKLYLDFNDTDIDILKLYACTFIDCATTVFPTAISGSECLDTVWNTCGVITPSTFKVHYCSVVNATSDGMICDSTSFDVAYTVFINPTDSGIWTSSDLSAGVDFQSITFVGTNGTTSYDVENTHATADFLINMLGTTVITYKNENPGTITAEQNVSLTIKVIDEDKSNIQNAQVAIYDSSGTQLMNEDTIADGTATESYTFTSPEDITIRVRKSATSDDPRYFPFSDTGQITSDGFYLQVTLEENPFI